MPDSALGAQGRTVRCAKCKHSWFQEPLEKPLPATAAAPSPEAAAPVAPPPPAPPPAAPPESPAPVAEPSISHWRSEDTLADTSDAPAPASAADDSQIAARVLRRGRAAPDAPPVSALEEDDRIAPPVFDDDTDPADEGEFSQFGYSAPFTRRRHTAKMWTLAAVLFAALATGTIAAVNYYGLPDWAPFTRPTFGMGKPGLELDFPAEQNRSETLASGDAIFRVRGTISNAARETLAVPNLLIVFRDERDRQVANWVVSPAKRELAPGESLNVTEAIADIPPSAVFAEIGWAPR